MMSLGAQTNYHGSLTPLSDVHQFESGHLSRRTSYLGPVLHSQTELQGQWSDPGPRATPDGQTRLPRYEKTLSRRDPSLGVVQP